MIANFSIKEAAVIADVPEAVVRKAIEARTICPVVEMAGRTPRYRFNAHGMLYLKVVTAFPLPLRRDDKQALWNIIEGKRSSSGRWYRCNDDLVTQSGGLELRVGLRNLEQDLADRLRVFEHGRHRIVSDPDVLSGEPVFKGTRIPLSHISALLAKNVPVEEIREDYPSLSSDELRYATMVSRMKLNPGRPRKPLTLIRDGHTVTTKDRFVSIGEAAVG